MVFQVNDRVKYKDIAKRDIGKYPEAFWHGTVTSVVEGVTVKWDETVKNEPDSDIYNEDQLILIPPNEAIN